MIRSMTGFGGASTQVDGAHYALEIRTLNNRYFKAQVRLPDELQGLEAELEAAMSRRINRGSVVLAVRFSDTSAEAAARINPAVIERYLEQMHAVKGVDHGSTHIDIGSLLALPGVLMTDPDEGRIERSRDVLLPLLSEAIDKLVAMRDREGEVLHVELHRHCRLIADHLEVVIECVPRIIEQYQQKLHQRMKTLLADTGAAVREEDLLREVAVFAERSDIAEEVARLQGHLEQFAQIIDSPTAEPTGRTLDFIAQEMLREANTIGSKCLDVEVSRRIVEIKGGIDRIKEQVQNVE
ncbi:MAG: YicC family protein [Planctomycetes bacterium]|nr:YicC family protein [Planctomycetota bacterium]